MLATQVVTFLIFLLNAGLGTFVLLREPANVINKRFCIFACALSVWTFFLFLTIQTTEPELAVLRLRLAFCAALFMPPAFFFFTSVFPDRAERSIDRYLSISFFTISSLLAFASSHIVESVSFENHLPHAIYGPLFSIFWSYFIACTFYSLYLLYRKSVHFYGIKRLQIQYLYLGITAAVILGAFTNFILPTMGIWQAERLVSLVTVPILVTVSYAIVKYHLMDIYLVVKKSTVYGTLSIVLGAIYFIVGLTLSSVLPVSKYSEAFTHFVSITVIVLTFVPIREAIQHVIEESLFHTKYSHAKILRDSTLMFSSISDLNRLLRYAIQILYDSVGIDKICILLRDVETKHYTLRAAINFPPEDNLLLPNHNAVVTWLCKNKSILSREQLSRFIQSGLDRLSEDTLASLDVDCCIPIFQENELFGIILLGKKVDKKPFTQEDIQMFLAFSGQLAMSINNAHLYAELKQAKIYRDNILQSLKSGVIVVNNNKEVTLINNEAKRILGLKDTSSSEGIFKGLGKDAYQLLNYTVSRDTEYNNIEIFVESGSKIIPCGVTTAQLKTEAGEKLGALIILTDQTELKLLQAEKQHANRLAAIGVLAANIAHEIKNPLVAINTYFQLLLQKGGDEEFHKDFQKLAATEVKRINRIVEMLLNLAKPSKPIVEYIEPHRVIVDTINLLMNVAVEKGAEITTNFVEKECQLIADEGQLKQVLINVMQNSLDALPGKGHINVSTNIIDGLSMFRRRLEQHPDSIFFSFASSTLLSHNSDPYFVIKVSDTGTGIPAEKMSSLFEPFYTTKDTGTGLGLSIVYRIIEDHKGSIYVESREGKGTDFYIGLPLSQVGSDGPKRKAAEILST